MDRFATKWESDLLYNCQARVTRCKYTNMKRLLVLFLLAFGLLFLTEPLFAQRQQSDTTTVSNAVVTNNTPKSETQLNKDRTEASQALNDEYKAKAKEARRIEREASKASKEMAKAERLERKAQKNREKANKQRVKARKAAAKSDDN